MHRFAVLGRISGKLYLLLGLFIAALVIVAGANKLSLQASLVDQKRTELKHLVEIGLSIARRNMPPRCGASAARRRPAAARPPASASCATAPTTITGSTTCTRAWSCIRSMRG